MIINFYFLEVDFSLTIHDLNLKLYRSIVKIAVKGKLSQILYPGPDCFFCCFFIKS